MRSITKGPGHFQLNARDALYQSQIVSGTAVSAEIAWNNFPHKEQTRSSCNAEQIGLCAFSETSIDNGTWGFHLDHVKPKSLDQSVTFKHSNLVLCAISADALKYMPKSEVFGGHFRGNRYSNSGFITPLRADARRFFHYSVEGEVVPALNLSKSDARKARYTIKILNLNATTLVEMRKNWLMELENEIDKLIGHPAAMDYFAMVELCDTNGRLRKFHSAVRERFAVAGQAVLMANCPDCD